jgi:hypothetical protein
MAESQQYSLSMFQDCLGQEFRLSMQDGNTAVFVLVEAVPRGGEGAAAQGDRDSFSVVFKDAAGSVNSHLPQSIYHFEHDRLGGLDLFVVPIGPPADGEGILYEAVFS